MASLSENVTKVVNAFSAIKSAIIAKGVTPTGGVLTYAAAIANITTASTSTIETGEITLPGATSKTVSFTVTKSSYSNVMIYYHASDSVHKFWALTVDCSASTPYYSGAYYYSGSYYKTDSSYDTAVVNQTDYMPTVTKSGNTFTVKTPAKYMYSGTARWMAY